jgi:hypothetical protein
MASKKKPVIRTMDSLGEHGNEALGWFRMNIFSEGWCPDCLGRLTEKMVCQRCKAKFEMEE